MTTIGVIKGAKFCRLKATKSRHVRQSTYRVSCDWMGYEGLQPETRAFDTGLCFSERVQVGSCHDFLETFEFPRTLVVTV